MQLWDISRSLLEFGGSADYLKNLTIIYNLLFIYASFTLLLFQKTKNWSTKKNYSKANENRSNKRIRNVKKKKKNNIFRCQIVIILN